MFLKDLTNEEIRKKNKFKSQFELVNYAIKLAENMIKSGRDSRIKMDVQNKALLILGEIASGKDQFEALLDQEEEAGFSLPLNEELPHHTLNSFKDNKRASEHLMKDLPPKKQRKLSL